jgi:hypothetical protein
MKTVCIETTPSAAIGWGIRYDNENFLYTTFSGTVDDRLREHNLARFDKEIMTTTKNELWSILQEDNNIQIISNHGVQKIPWLYKFPENHPILSKTWIINIFWDNGLSSYLPRSFIIPHVQVNLDSIIEKIKTNFLSWSKIIIKHSWIDGNGSGVWIIDYKQNWNNLKKDVASVIDKFSKHFDWDQNMVFWSDYLIQECLSDILGEWSITFSLQNTTVENLWLANNVVLWWEYFWSTNIFPYLHKEQAAIISNQIQRDFSSVLSQLQQEGVRWNVWFDIIFKNTSWKVIPYVLESNWIHRMTWSIMPNNFAHNTKNEVFLWLPISKRYLAYEYQDLSVHSLLNLAQKLEWFWTTDWQEQIMNIKCEWLEWWHPALRIALAWPSQNELFQLFRDSWITNEAWKEYVNTVFKKMII